MYELDGCADTEFAELEQFRLKPIGFLRLPLSIKEAQLRQALKECSPGAFDNYLRRFNGVLDLKNRTDLI